MYSYLIFSETDLWPTTIVNVDDIVDSLLKMYNGNEEIAFVKLAKVINACAMAKNDGDIIVNMDGNATLKICIDGSVKTNCAWDN